MNTVFFASDRMLWIGQIGQVERLEKGPGSKSLGRANCKVIRPATREEYETWHKLNGEDPGFIPEGAFFYEGHID